MEVSNPQWCWYGPAALRWRGRLMSVDVRCKRCGNQWTATPGDNQAQFSFVGKKIAVTCRCGVTSVGTLPRNEAP